MVKYLKTLSFFLIFFSSVIGFSQVEEPVTWKTEAHKISDTEYELIFTATIDEGWHFYSQVPADPDGMGPIATEFNFIDQEGNYETIGKTSETETKKVFEAAFDMDVSYFENEAVFKQKVKLINTELEAVNSEVYFQDCNEERCLTPDVFEFKTYFSNEKNLAVAELTDHDIAMSKALILDIKGKEDYEAQSIKTKSYLMIFLLGFLGGLIALLTPCVFPMIPLTVSFFTKGAKEGKGVFNSIMYGFFIFLIYVLLSLPFHLFDSLDSDILNNISTNVTLNILFFIIFIAFAFSFFGYFELTLPSSWSNALDDKANKIGGVIGIFFMALTLAIVSFSCTGPILGTLLGNSLAGDNSAFQLSMGMSGFGLALALPFALFAMFPKWLNSLPKSGSWLNTVKVVLGFIELALALKFLSNADLVEQWGLLKREIFIGLWIIIGIGLILYLFGKIKFPHDGPINKLGKGRITTAILIVAFVIYLIPGLTNTKYANLKLLSGFPPPLSYSLYEKEEAYTLIKDLNEGLEMAKEMKKPIMIDFTGWACVNCREMEEQVWTDDAVNEILVNDYIIVSLYVDDKRALPEEEQFKFLRPSGTIKNIKTIGDKWGILQTLNFQNNSQPYYVLLNSNLDMLNRTSVREKNKDTYLNWLKQGLEKFNTLQKNELGFKFSN